MKKPRNKFPKGWNEKIVRKLIEHYENQSESEAVAEDEAAYHSAHITMMAIPAKLVPKVQRLITKSAG